MTQRAAARWILITSIGLLCFSAFPVHPARAADLDFVADYLNRQQANLANGVTHTIFIMPATSLPVPGNSFRVVFPKSPVGTWCRIAGNDLSVSGVSDPSGSSELATPLPGPLSASCTIGDGVTTFDTITVNGIGPLTAGVKYGVSIVGSNIAQLGTPPPANSIWEVLTTNNGVSDVDSLLYYAVSLPTDQLSVTAIVAATPPANPNPTIQFTGLSAPSGSLTVTRDGSSVSTIPVGSDAAFDVNLTDQPIGQHIYLLQALDRDGRSLPPATYAITMASGSTTVVNNIFLGPTIVVDPATVTAGQTVNVSGNTVPNSTVTIFISGATPFTFTAPSDSSGRWQKNIVSSDVGVGTHTVRARAFLSGTIISEFSVTLNLTVEQPVSEPIVPVVPPVKKPTKTPTPTPEPNGPPTVSPRVIPPGCEKTSKADLNCDGKIDLSDFSIILAYWQSTSAKNVLVDINEDGKVDIVDFSIVLSLWTV